VDSLTLNSSDLTVLSYAGEFYPTYTVPEINIKKTTFSTFERERSD